MAIGMKVAEARKRLGLSQQELSTKVPVTREAIAKYETGKRPFPEDLLPSFCEGLDDALFTKEIQRESTGGAYIPYLDGPIVEHHPASLIFLARKELKEAKAHLNEIDVSKPLSMMSEQEKDHLHRTIYELLDAAAAAETLAIDICSRFNLSYTSEVKQWIGSLMGRQLIQRRYG